MWLLLLFNCLWWLQNNLTDQLFIITLFNYINSFLLLSIWILIFQMDSKNEGEWMKIFIQMQKLLPKFDLILE